MSQVILNENEIKGLKVENWKLDEVIKKKEEERNNFENKSKELLEKNENLTENVLGQFLV